MDPDIAAMLETMKKQQQQFNQTLAGLKKAEPITQVVSSPQSINQFSGPAYPWGVAGAAARVGASKHLDPLRQRIDALLGCLGETN